MAEAKITLSAVDQTKAAFESVKGNLTALHTQAVAVTGAIAALGVTTFVAGMVSGIHEVLEQWDELGKAAQRAGMQSAQSMAEFQYAAKLAGVEAGGLEQAVGKLASKMADAAGGNKDAVASFAALGVQIQDSAGHLRNTEDVLTDLAGKFSSFKDSPEKTALALDLFGKSGKALIPLLNGGAEGLQDLRAEFQKLRGVLDDRTIKAAEQFNDNLSRLETAAGGLKRALAEDVLPGLVQVTDAMVDQAKKGSTLLAVWAGLKEFGKIATNSDELGGAIRGADTVQRQLEAKSSQLDSMLQAQANGSGNDIIDRRVINLRKEIEQLQRQALDATHALKSMLSPGYDGTSTGDFTRLDRKTPLTTAPIPKKTDTTGPAAESAYRSLNKTIEERLKLAGAELSAHHELTDAEKFESKVLEELKQSKVKVSAAEEADIKAKLGRLKADELQVQKQREQLKLGDEIGNQQARIAELDAKYLGEQAEANEKRNGTAKDMLAQIEFETKLLSMNTQQREVALATRELEKQGIKEGTTAWATYGAAIQAAAGKRAQAQEQIEGFKTVWQSIDSTAHDVWTNIFEGGTNVFKKLGDTLKASVLDILYQMTIKKWIVSIAASITGTPAAMAAQAAGLTGGGGIGGMLSGASGVGSMFSGASALGGLAGGASLFGSGVMSGLSAWGAGGSVTGLLGSGTLMAGGMANGLGLIAGALGPIALGVGALYALYQGLKGGETRSGGQYSGTSLVAAPSGGEIGGDTVRNSITATSKSINDTLAALGSSARLGNLVTGLESSKAGKGFAYAGGALSNGTVFGQGIDGMGYMNRRGDMTTDQASAAFAEELKQATLQALQAADVPGQLGDYLRQLGNIDELSGGALDAALARINKALAEKQSLEDKWFDLTSTDAEKLATARQKELDALDDSNKAMAYRIYALQDELSLQEKVKGALDKASQSAKAAAEFISGLKFDLRVYVDKLNGTPAGMLSPEAQLANSRSQFDKQLTLARSGDRGALQGITGYADQLISAQTAWTASGPQTQQTIEMIRQAMMDLPDHLTPEQLISDTLQQTADGVKLAIDANGNIIASAVDANGNVITAALDATGSIISTSMSDLIAHADVNAAAQIAALTASQAAATAAITAAMASSTAAVASAAPPPVAPPNWGGTQFATENDYRAYQDSTNYSAAIGGSFRAGDVVDVGEHGRERVVFSQPGRVLTAQQTRNGDAVGDPAIAARLDAVVRSVDGLRVLVASYAQRDLESSGQIVRNTGAAAEQQRLDRVRPVPVRA